MKIKILTLIANFILGKVIKDDEPRADMFLPMWLLAFSLVLSIIGCTLVIVSIFKFSLWAVIGAALAIVLGIAALLCWRNQSIVISSDETFVYTTFLGNKKTYYFNDITGLKKNNDSLTLVLGKNKVHIESCAFLTDRLVNKINAQLETLYAEQSVK